MNSTESMFLLMIYIVPSLVVLMLAAWVADHLVQPWLDARRRRL
jgi:hypothetical protein